MLFLWKKSNTSVQRQKEILHLERRLMEFDIRFSSLVYPPSGVGTQTLIEISKSVAQNNELLNTLSSKRELEVEQLVANGIGVCPKVLEENHHYIVTMAHIIGGPYPYLREYVRSCII